MPVTHFICPDAVTRPIKECFDKCPRQEGRCLSLPTLQSIGQQREWKGKPSTTMLIKGVRQTYLEITRDYAINPFDMAFALLGTRHHRRLEIMADKLGLIAEESVGREISGMLDLLEPDELNNGYYKLIDYKTSGSYAIAKALGRLNRDADMREWELQINRYRVEAEKLGFPISRMFVQATVRDGGTRSARDNNVPEKLKMIEVTKLDDDYIEKYFADKACELLTALDIKILPGLCDYESRWGGRRCKGFCPVFMYCPEGAKVNKVELVV